MSSAQLARVRTAILVVVLVAVAAVIAVIVLRGGGDDAKVVNAGPSRTPTAEATASPTPTKSPSATPSASATSPAGQPCDDGKRDIDPTGVDEDTLPVDCGLAPVSVAEEKKSGLTVACGGRYPVILYKTYTKRGQASVCGVDASGAKFRIAFKPKDGEAIDMAGRYVSDLDAFIGEDQGTEYGILGYDGTLVVTAPSGTMKSYKASDWMTLDNEDDAD